MMYKQMSNHPSKDELVVDGLNQSELQLTKDFLEELSLRHQDQNNEPISWECGIKFLMARKFDVRRAVELFLSHEAIREKENIQHIDPREDSVRRELLSEKFTILPGRDINEASIALFSARHHSSSRSTHAAVLKSLIFQLDAALTSRETQRNGLVLVYDMSSSKYSNFDYDLSIKILSMLKGSYPARLKKVLIVTAPLWFKAPFKILRLFVREKLRDRVYTVNMSQLSQHIPTTSLPKCLGGRIDVNHRDWIKKCLKLNWGKQSETDNEIVAYLEACDNRNVLDLNLSGTSATGSMTSQMDESIIFSSDIESESSHDTVQEKHNSEYKEKELRLAVEELEPCDDVTMTSPVTSPAVPKQLIVVGTQIPQKRGSDMSPREMTLDESSIPPLPRKKRPNLATTSPAEESIHLPEQGGYTIKELLEYCRIKQRKGLFRQYAKIRAEPPAGTFEHAHLKANASKNRYTDVLCMDHSRVQLNIIDEDPNSDYINANFVDGYKHKNAYISTQGPLPRTFVDFWRMIWEQMVLVIVMTTRTVENARLKCGQYWPADMEEIEEYGQFTILNNGVENLDAYRITSLILQNNDTQETREVIHMQFLSWPDYGVPHCADAFLRFMLHVRRVQQERLQACGTALSENHPLGPPIVIHCSAGIGRTGTFITVDICTRRLVDIGTVNIQKTVSRIRSQRAFSIQMPDQYVFCHLALLEYAQKEGCIASIDLDNFEDSSSESE